MQLPDTRDMYASMAAKIGNTCKCEKCGRRVVVDAAKCLARGWPECCGYTMTLLSKKGAGDER